MIIYFMISAIVAFISAIIFLITNDDGYDEFIDEVIRSLIGGLLGIIWPATIISVLAILTAKLIKKKLGKKE